jgi:hypothetical protein
LVQESSLQPILDALDARGRRVAAGYEERLGKERREREQAKIAENATAEENCNTRMANERAALIAVHTSEVDRRVAERAAERVERAAERAALVAVHTSEVDRMVAVHTREIDRMVAERAAERAALIADSKTACDELNRKLEQREAECRQLIAELTKMQVNTAAAVPHVAPWGYRVPLFPTRLVPQDVLANPSMAPYGAAEAVLRLDTVEAAGSPVRLAGVNKVGMAAGIPQDKGGSGGKRGGGGNAGGPGGRGAGRGH